jgi:predicted HTH domain antitoxin
MVKIKSSDKEKMNVKTLRLKDSSSSIIYAIAKEKNLTESEYIRSIIEKEVLKYRFNKAVELYRKKEINISEASEIAGLTYRDFLDKLESKSIPLNLDTVPLKYGLDSIKKSLK